MSLRADIENAIGDTLDTMHLADVIRLADAIMPLVERAVREGAKAAWSAGADWWDTDRVTIATPQIDAIVARVLK